MKCQKCKGDVRITVQEVNVGNEDKLDIQVVCRNNECEWPGAFTFVGESDLVEAE